jgi:hypothetical protein
MEQNRKINKISRKRFLYWILPLLGSSAIVFSFRSIYSGLFSKVISKSNNNSFLKSGKNKRRVRTRGKWTQENLILNTKTNIVHYPSSKIYVYYDRISDKHISVIDFNSWKNQVASPKHFNKAKSGVILEKLALRELSAPITSEKLAKATENLSLAFSKDYARMNSTSWRLYDLLLQCIALDTNVQMQIKWSIFLKIIENTNVKILKIPKRNAWLNSKTEFDKRVIYIHDNSEKYIKRLEKRI